MFLFSAIVLFSVSIGFSSNFAFPCWTPNHESAFCISLFSCPVLMKSLGTLDTSAINFVKRSVCCDSASGDILVCCGTKGNFIGRRPGIALESKAKVTTQKITTTTKLTTRPTTTTSRTPLLTTIPQIFTEEPPQAPFTSKPYKRPSSTISPDESRSELLPSRKDCGFQHNEDTFYKDGATALDEFPWLAHVLFVEDEHDDPFQFLDRCNGVLINQRYVLTSKFCGNEAKSVRLGQYYTNQSVACIKNTNYPECTEPRLQIDVEKEIHRINETGWHEFTLLRLAADITYSDFIRPICLPMDDAPRPEVFTFSGWGGRENIGSVKKRILYKPTNLDECYKLDKHNLKEAKHLTAVCLAPSQKNGELACTGDEAGPLMYTNLHQWFLDSIITSVYYKFQFNHNNRCSNEYPIAGLKITKDVMDWIIDNIRA